MNNVSRDTRQLEDGDVDSVAYTTVCSTANGRYVSSKLFTPNV